MTTHIIRRLHALDLRKPVETLCGRRLVSGTKSVAPPSQATCMRCVAEDIAKPATAIAS